MASIKVATGFVPAVAFFAVAAVMLAYPLTERAFRNLVPALAERRAARDVGGSTRPSSPPRARTPPSGQRARPIGQASVRTSAPSWAQRVWKIPSRSTRR